MLAGMALGFWPGVPHRMMKLLKIALLLVSILLLAIGGEGIYHAARSRQQIALTCEQFTGPPPRRACGCV